MALPKSLLNQAQKYIEEQEAIAPRQVGSNGEALPLVQWKPNPPRPGVSISPQQLALETQADELFYGGAAGAGKTDLLLGLAFTCQRNSIIFRREYEQLKGIITRSRELATAHGRYNTTEKVWQLADGRRLEFGAVQHEWDVEGYQGRPHDFKGFDELAHFSRAQYYFLCGWLRTSVRGQRCRIVATGNPPTTPEGRWIIEEWAPWLDDQSPDPAEPGELRWYSMLDGVLTWFKSGETFEYKSKSGKVEIITPRSRTFIPGNVDDNPHLLETGYKAVLQSRPEPLRSQVLYGDFKAGLQDDAWQVIPTEWVRAAQRRWTDARPRDAFLTCVGTDIAAGGSAKTVLALRYKHWIAPLMKYPGQATPDGVVVAQLIKSIIDPIPTNHRPGLAVNFDCIGVGAGLAAAGKLLGIHYLVPVNFAASGGGTDRTGNMTFVNMRAFAYWYLRDMLDPSRPLAKDELPLALPPDNELLADLTAPRWGMTMSGVRIEKKEEIAKRIGRSTDCGDAVVYACVPTIAGGIMPQWIK